MVYPALSIGIGIATFSSFLLSLYSIIVLKSLLKTTYSLAARGYFAEKGKFVIRVWIGVCIIITVTFDIAMRITG